MPHTRPDWPPVLLDLPSDAWTTRDGNPHTRIRVAGVAMDLTGTPVAVVDDIQQGLDPAAETRLRALYDPEDPFQTWTRHETQYALYATPSADQESPVVADIAVERATWAGWMPDFEEIDRKLITAVVAGHCALHVEARRVLGEEQRLAGDSDDRAALTALAGWEGPFPTVRIDDHDYVVFMYPHGD